jgi:menaquinol-cytochrome c reductase iron-sulfur subunit
MERQPDFDKPIEPERRGVLVKCIYTLSALMTGTLAASVGTYLGGTPRAADENAWSDAGEIANLRAGAPREISFERIRMDGWKETTEKATAWVVLDNQDRLTAFSPLCPHLGCAYRWEAQKELFVCPCHGSEFKEDGAVLKGPAGRQLDRYVTKVESNRLWLGPVQVPGKS